MFVLTRRTRPSTPEATWLNVSISPRSRLRRFVGVFTTATVDRGAREVREEVKRHSCTLEVRLVRVKGCQTCVPSPGAVISCTCGSTSRRMISAFSSAAAVVTRVLACAKHMQDDSVFRRGGASNVWTALQDRSRAVWPTQIPHN